MLKKWNPEKLLRSKYEQVKRLYHKVGKKAAGKPARSQVQRDYVELRAEYHRLGRRLGLLTKKRSRS
jgi:hypothetical protein